MNSNSGLVCFRAIIALLARWKGYKRIEIFDDGETSQEDNAIADDEEIAVERDRNDFILYVTPIPIHF